MSAKTFRVVLGFVFVQTTFNIVGDADVDTGVVFVGDDVGGVGSIVHGG